MLFCSHERREERGPREDAQLVQLSTGNSIMGRSIVRSVSHTETHCPNVSKKLSHVKCHRLFNCSQLPNLQKEVDVQQDALSSSIQSLTCILSTDVKGRVGRRHIEPTAALYFVTIFMKLLLKSKALLMECSSTVLWFSTFRLCQLYAQISIQIS